MGAYKKYIDNLEKRKTELVTVLNNKGVTATNDESLETLVPKVNNIQKAKTEQTKTVALSMASGNQTVNPDSGKVLSKVTITKPDTLIPENIKKDITIGGVVGTLESSSSSGGGSSETWVLNSSINTSTKFSVTINFISNNIEYNSISLSGVAAPTVSGKSYGLYYNSTSILPAESGGIFSKSFDGNYRKIIFETVPTGDLLTWLQANAVKQDSTLAIQDTKSITITENGTTEITADTPYDVVKKVNVTTNVVTTKQPLTAEYIKANWIQLSLNRGIGASILYKISENNYKGKMLAYISSEENGLNIGNNVQIIYSALDTNDEAGRYFVCSDNADLCYLYIENDSLWYTSMDFDSSNMFFDFILSNGRDILLFNSHESDFNGDKITCFYLEP